MIKDYVLSVAVSHDGQWVVSGSKDRGVQFWDSRSAIVQFMLQGHKNSGNFFLRYYLQDSLTGNQSSLLILAPLQVYSLPAAVIGLREYVRTTDPVWVTLINELS